MSSGSAAAAQFTCRCASPLGDILLAGSESALTGLWFEGQKHFARGLAQPCQARDLPIFEAARRWLDVYFSGREPNLELPLHPVGTPFQIQVWQALRAIPYGQTLSYGALAARLAVARGVPRLSARAVGGAVGCNPISILIPCHRVVGADGSLTGYAGGVDRKARLLALERGRLE